jgi:hypothetical protein
MKEQLKELSISAILNVSTCCRNHFPQDFRYKVIPVEDSDSADLSTWFADAFHFIGKRFGIFGETAGLLLRVQAYSKPSMVYILGCFGKEFKKPT